MRKFWISICIGIWMGWPGSIQAQSKSSVAGVTALGIRLPILRKPSPEAGQIKRRVQEWFRLWRRGKHSVALQSCKEIQQLQHELGVSNLFLFASALVQEGDKLYEKGKTDRANSLYRWAQKVAPSLSRPYFRLSWMIVRHHPGQIHTAFPVFWKGLMAQIRSPIEATVVLVGVSRFLGWTLGLSFALLWFFLLLRCLRPLLFDFHGLFPRGVTPFQMSLLSMLLLLLPPLMGAGVLETLLCWTLFAWFYQSTRERILTTTGLLLVSALPFVLLFMGRLVSVINSPVQDLYMLNHSTTRIATARRLERYLRSHPKSLDVLWSLGLYYKRLGRALEARRMYQRAIRVKSDPSLQVNLANLAFLVREPEKAFFLYQKALKRKALPEGLFNFSQLLKHSTATQQELMQQKADARDAALQKGGKRVEAFEKQVQPHINRYIMDIALPSHRYWQRLLEQKDRTALQARIWGRISTWIPLDYAPWTGALFALLLWFLVPVGRRYFQGRSCVQCGTIYDREESHSAICGQCSHLFEKKEGSPARRVQKEFEIQRFQRKRYYSQAILSFLVMGAGQILRQKAFKGFLYLLCLTATLYVWIFTQPLISHPMSVGDSQYLWLNIALTSVTVLLYVLSLRETLNDD